MAECLIKNSEYRTKLAQSGIPEFIFYSVANDFVAEHGRFPNLDELPGSNSVKYLKDSLHINDLNSTKIDDILVTTGTDNLKDANITINDSFSDLLVEVKPLKTEAIVDIKQRPSTSNVIKDVSEINVEDNPNMGVVFNTMFDKLRNLYGIDLIPVTNKQLSNSKWSEIPEVLTAAAFVHNGNIYVNTDLAKADAPIHEMTHILLGSIRFKNPDLYKQLISVADQFSNFTTIAFQNPNRTQEDIYEEAFVQETAKYLAGYKSALNELDPNILYEIHYNIKRLLDTALMGQYSVNSYSDNDLYKMSLKELAKGVKSTIMQSTTMSSLDDAALHRILSNTKSELMKQNKLREEC